MTIIGYTFKAENYTPKGLIEHLVNEGVRSPGAYGMSAEDVLDQWAGEEGVDRDDEWSFDSSDFPKPLDSDLHSIAVGTTYRNEDGDYVDAHGNEVS